MHRAPATAAFADLADAWQRWQDTACAAALSALVEGMTPEGKRLLVVVPGVAPVDALGAMLPRARFVHVRPDREEETRGARQELVGVLGRFVEVASVDGLGAVAWLGEGAEEAGDDDADRCRVCRRSGQNLSAFRHA